MRATLPRCSPPNDCCAAGAIIGLTGDAQEEDLATFAAAGLNCVRAAAAGQLRAVGWTGAGDDEARFPPEAEDAIQQPRHRAGTGFLMN